jgi:DNA invertase Pin-like site-specific DNA recombinase
MRAAVYARKSDDSPSGVADQVQHARNFIVTKGWTVAEGAVFTDVDVSGGVFKRPGLDALLAALGAKPRAFDAVVMMESSRLGREMAQTLALQMKITQAGVRIFHYQDGVELLVNTPTQKLVAQVNSFGAEDFKYQIGLKTKAAKKIRASEGYANGMAPLGYVNERVGEKGSALSRVKQVVDPKQAKIVTRIFTLCAEGKGLMRIAATLNADGVENPTGQVRHNSKKVGSAWSSTSIREVLGRERYVEIIGQDLWDRAQERIARARAAYSPGEKTERPEAGLDAKYLLSGFLICAECRAPLMAVKSHRESGTVMTYACSTRRKRGTKACSVRGRLSMPAITESVIWHLREILTPQRLTEYIDTMVALAAKPEAGIERQRVAEDIARLDRELKTLTDAVARGASIESLLGALQQREQERQGLRDRLAHLDAMAKTAKSFNPVKYRREVEAVLKSWHHVLASDPTKGRTLLRACLDGPVTVSHNADGSWSYSGALLWGRQIRGALNIPEAETNDPSSRRR